MANALNYFPCSLIGGNVGFGNCTIDIKNIVGAIIVPHGTSFSQTQTLTAASFVAALQTATYAARSQRAFPIHGFEEIRDNSEGVTEDKLGYGGAAITREGFYKWGFRILKGGFCLSKSLRKFNNQNVDVFFVDANNLVIGQKYVSGGVTTFRGINQEYVYQEPFKVNDGSKTSIYMQNFVFAPGFIDNFGGIQLNAGDFDTVVGLQDVVLYSGGARVANVSKAKGSFSCGGDDLGSTFGALLVANLWVVRDSVSGNQIAITSVTFDAASSTYTITVSTSDPNYVAGNPVIISLADAAALNAAGISTINGGIESIPFVTPN